MEEESAALRTESSGPDLAAPPDGDLPAVGRRRKAQRRRGLREL